MDGMEYDCAKCAVVEKICRLENGKGPKWCPTKTEGETLAGALKEYDDPDLKEFARVASVQEGSCYACRDAKPFMMIPTKSRIEELIEFSQRMGYKRLGMAFCGGLTHEAAALSEILEKNGFEVISVSCKVGCIPKERIGVKNEEKIRIGKFESMCNPIAQAKILNQAKTEFNIMLGLCIGHDSLFLKYVEGLTTVFATKDRVTGHNPMVTLYTSRSYYQRMMKMEFGSLEEMKSRLVPGQEK
ncbi:MAG TPA: DUF1847 domain-containing protein [Thermodesulfobacteriota bacterium]|jgi:uncharacterized metal-binding protein|nr:DUF1847 domain-containing protein [Thermodesulfobacteriota bacterium]